MGSILNESDRTTIVSRVQSLSASSAARWGKMNVIDMLQHLRLSAQMTLGEILLLRRTSVRSRYFHSSTLSCTCFRSRRERRPRVSFIQVKRGLLRKNGHHCWICWTRIAAGPREGNGPAHPLFGPLSWREWGVVTFKHVDHHLKQFGA